MLLLQSPPATRIESSDRLSLTLFLAIVLHSILILGVSFQLPDKPSNTNPLPTMEITLVHHSSKEAPDEADLLAQANQRGGGESQRKVAPTSPASAPLFSPQQGVAAYSQQARPKPSQPKRELLTVESAPFVLKTSQRQPEREQQPNPSALELVSRSMEIASLSAAIEKHVRMEAHNPRESYISARTRESKYVAYMEAWRAKVEKIGNLNYPEEARRRKLTGSLILDVGINPNGTIYEINLVRSSGSRPLDDAAMRIVRLAAPFAPLPQVIREETDILHIIRTWQFLNDNRLYGG